MTETFPTLIPDARAFYARLSDNNSKAWFNENKPEYEQKIKAPAQQLLKQIAPRLSELLDQPVTTKIFRPHRDVRFSKDKSAYKTHLHVLWSPQGNGTQPAYFFGVAQDYVTAGAGIRNFDKRQQSEWRGWVSEEIEGKRLQADLDAALSTGATLGKPELKRVPSPFGQDHPQGELLRRKSLIMWKDIANDADTAGLPSALWTAFEDFNPVMDHMRAML